MDLNLKKDRNVRRKPSIDVSSLVYGKIPPQAKELEEAVLGAVMLEKGAFDTVIEILKGECFYVEAHQIIFSAMTRLAGKSMPVDILTVTEELKSMGSRTDRRTIYRYEAHQHGGIFREYRSACPYYPSEIYSTGTDPHFR